MSRGSDKGNSQGNEVDTHATPPKLSLESWCDCCSLQPPAELQQEREAEEQREREAAKRAKAELRKRRKEEKEREATEQRRATEEEELAGIIATFNPQPIPFSWSCSIFRHTRAAGGERL